MNAVILKLCKTTLSMFIFNILLHSLEYSSIVSSVFLYFPLLFVFHWHTKQYCTKSSVVKLSKSDLWKQIFCKIGAVSEQTVSEQTVILYEPLQYTNLVLSICRLRSDDSAGNSGAAGPVGVANLGHPKRQI